MSLYTTKEQGKGTGLGLSTVYGIVKQSGGNIWVYTEVGRGTTFKIYLPQVEGPIELARPEPQPVVALGGTETVLLAEDDDLVRNFVRSALQEKGYTVLEAHHGTEALRIAIQYTDPIQPANGSGDAHMSGKMARPAPVTLRPGIKVLLMSGYSENVSSITERHAETPIPFIEKPFTVENLARKVREVLDTQPKS